MRPRRAGSYIVKDASSHARRPPVMPAEARRRYKPAQPTDEDRQLVAALLRARQSEGSGE